MRIQLIGFFLAFIIAGVSYSQQADSMPIQVRGDIVENLEGKFSATFQATPLSDVFKMIAADAGLNIMVSPKITQNLTAKFKEVPIKDAFLAILSANDLFYIEQGSILKIVTLQEYRNELLRNRIISKAYDASIIDIKNLSAVLKPILTPGVGNFMVDENSSKIIVMDVKDNFARIDQLFTELTSLPRIVEIESTILKVALGDNSQFGVNWNALGQGNISNVTLVDNPQNSSADASLKVIARYFDPTQLVDYSIAISALAKDSRTKLVSQPRVLAMNREKATILIGDKVPYIKSVVSSDTTGKTTSQVDFIDTGVKLEVEPLITPENDVRLSIKAQSSTHQFISISQNETAPQITTTEVSCDTVVKDGELIVIGGLIKNTLEKNHRKVPFLGDIPFLGYLFSYTSETIEKSELIIILTPHIIRPGMAINNISTNMQNAIRESVITNSSNSNNN